MSQLSTGRYLLFVYRHEYPHGGWRDAQNRSDDLDSLIEQGWEHLAGPNYRYSMTTAEVVDLTTGERVRES